MNRIVSTCTSHYLYSSSLTHSLNGTICHRRTQVSQQSPAFPEANLRLWFTAIHSDLHPTQQVSCHFRWMEPSAASTFQNEITYYWLATGLHPRLFHCCYMLVPISPHYNLLSSCSFLPYFSKWRHTQANQQNERFQFCWNWDASDLPGLIPDTCSLHVGRSLGGILNHKGALKPNPHL